MFVIVERLAPFMKIQTVTALQIFDSRGQPTVEVEITLEGGGRGRGLVPSGASTGQFEAMELRDGDVGKFRGKSVFRAIENIEKQIAPAVSGHDAEDQRSLDEALVALDGTSNKGRLGANAILGVSMAAAVAVANAKQLSLYESLGDGVTLPFPEIQILGGGAHAGWRTDVQDFLLMATGATTYDEALEITYNVYHAAGDLLRERGSYCGLADEGGYWPDFRSGETEDAFIAHLAVATDAGQLKVGSFARSERMAKWNEVLRIARSLGSRATFPGRTVLTGSGGIS